MDLKHSHINIDRLYVMAMCGFGVCLCVCLCVPYLKWMLFPLQPDPVLLSDRLYSDKMLCMHKRHMITLFLEVSAALGSRSTNTVGRGVWPAHTL